MKLSEEDLEKLISVMKIDYETVKHKSKKYLDNYELGFCDGVEETMESMIQLLKELKNH